MKDQITESAPLELAIQEMEAQEAPGWATAGGAVVSALSVAGSAAVAYT